MSSQRRFLDDFVKIYEILLTEQAFERRMAPTWWELSEANVCHPTPIGICGATRMPVGSGTPTDSEVLFGGRHCGLSCIWIYLKPMSSQASRVSAGNPSRHHIGCSRAGMGKVQYHLPMNIMLVTPWRPSLTGGISTVITRLTREFQKKGHSVRIFVADKENRLPQIESLDRYACLRHVPSVACIIYPSDSCDHHE